MFRSFARAAKASALSTVAEPTGLHSEHGPGARPAARIRAPARAAAAEDRLGRRGRARGTRGEPREAVDQARGEGVRARPRDPDDGPDDARGTGHAREGRRARVEG